MINLESGSSFSYTPDGYLEAVMFIFPRGSEILTENRLEKTPPEPFIPNGKIELKDIQPGKDYKDVALQREILEEFQGKVQPLEYSQLDEYKVDEIKVIFYLYLIQKWAGEIPAASFEEGVKSADLEWRSVDEAEKVFQFPVLHFAIQKVKNFILNNNTQENK